MGSFRDMAFVRRFRRLLITGVVGANLVVAALAAHSLYESRQQYEQRARIQTQNVALAVDQAVSNSIEKIDLALRAVTDELERQVAAGGIDERAMTVFLGRHEGRIPDIEAIRVANADGLVILGKGLDKTARTSWSDRDYFTYLRGHADGGLQISKPRMGRVAKQYIVGFARRYNRPDGSFAGVVSAPIAVAHFTRLLENFDLGPNGTAVLRDADLGLVTRYPPIPDRPAGVIGSTGVSRELVELAKSGVLQANYHTSTSADNLERTLAFRRIANAPMIVLAGVASDDYLADWRREAHQTAAFVAVLVLLSAASVGFLLNLLSRITHEGQRLRASEAAQRESEAILRSAIDTIDEAFVIYDRDDRLVYCNQKYREYYQTSADLLVPGRTFEDIIRIGAERGQYAEAAGRVDAWVTERLAAHRRGDTELIQKLDDGHWLKILERRTPEGHIVGFRIDITQLYRAKEAAEAANLAKSQFLATMSHEIRTPLNGVLGMAQLLLMPELTDAERREYARTILSSGQTLLTLLNDILDLSKVEAGKIVLERTDFEPDQIVRETAALFAEGAHAKGLALEASWSGPAGQRYLADPLRLRQMLSNLVSNAIKFTSAGLIRVDGREIERRGNEVTLEFSVEDSGIGVAPDKHERLFKPFSQIDSSTTRQFGGTGLGLSIVRSLARLMGGEVGVDSEVGRGARFWFHIRAGLIEGDADSRHHARTEEADATTTGAAPRRILVVEDNSTNRAVIQAMLKKRGLEVSCVGNGAEALDALAAGTAPDLILMDCQMPVLDGFAATASIRRQEGERAAARVPIVALTAGAFSDDRERCLAAGMDDFLAKPVSADELYAVIDRWTAAAATAAG